MRGASTGARAKSVFVGALCPVFMNTIIIMIARAAGSRRACNEQHGVIETFEISCLRKQVRNFGFLFILTEIMFRVFYVHYTEELDFSILFYRLSSFTRKILKIYSLLEC